MQKVFNTSSKYVDAYVSGIFGGNINIQNIVDHINNDRIHLTEPEKAFIEQLMAGGGQPGPIQGAVTSVNGILPNPAGELILTAQNIGAIDGLIQTPDVITLQSGNVNVVNIEIIEVATIDALINGLV